MATKAATRKSSAAKALGESKRERFVRLAERRTSKALQSIRLIANLSNRNNYEFYPADAKKILGVLSREIDDLRHRFENAPGRAASKFKL